MTLFWVMAGLFIIAALLFILPPLLQRRAQNKHGPGRKELNVEIYKDKLAELDQDLQNGTIDQDQYEKVQMEMKKGLAEDLQGEPSQEQLQSEEKIGKMTAIVVGISLPIISILLYLQFGGGPHAVDPESAPVASENTQIHEGELENMIASLIDRLEKNPNDAEGWVMLARSYYFMKDHQKASQAYAKAMALGGESNPDVLTDYADTLAMASGRSLTGKPYELVKQALTLQPFHGKALWLAGTAAYEQRDFETAKMYWQKLLQMMQPESQEAAQIKANLQELDSLIAKAGAGGPQMGAPATVVANDEATKTSSTGVLGTSVSGTVKIAPVLVNGANPSDTVFVFAKAVNGPRMPLAILKKQVKDLPISFELNDAMAMNPAAKISDFSEVVVEARISKSGNAFAQSGDLEGKSPVISVGTTDIPVLINSVIP